GFPGANMPTLEKIFREHRDMVFRICSRYCRDRAEAEDLTQEVFLRIDRSLPSFRGEADLGSWIYRLATNRCLDHLRGIKARNRLSESYLDSLVVRNLDSEGDRMHAKIELERILGQIMPRTRKILFLTLAEGLSYREAGEVLSVSRESVAKTVQRFLAKTQSAQAHRAGSRSPEAREYLAKYASLQSGLTLERIAGRKESFAGAAARIWETAGEAVRGGRAGWAGLALTCLLVVGAGSLTWNIRTDAENVPDREGSGLRAKGAGAGVRLIIGGVEYEPGQLSQA